MSHPTLYELFCARDDRDCHKWHHYFEVYERYLRPFLLREQLKMLEIGVQKGGSQRLWKEYFGERVRLYGMDIDPTCAKLRKEGFEIFIGDQADPQFIAKTLTKTGPLDVIIDDGGHSTDQQIMSFLLLFPHLMEGGVYIVEDLHTNLWMSYNNSRFGISFYDYAKGLADKLSLWHTDIRLAEYYGVPPKQRPQQIQNPNPIARELFGIHFYDSMIVFEKRRIAPPWQERR